MNILVFPCASGIGQEIYNSLIEYKNINIYGLNYGKNNAGYFLYKNYIEFNYNIDNPLFFDKLNEIINQYKINYIFPAYDDIIVFLKQNEEKIKSKILISNLNSVKITRSKLLTYEYLKDIIRVPKIYNKYNIEFPAFIKPDKGSGSIGCYKINDINEIPNNLENIIICEYLPYDEFTVDCLSDNNNKILYSSPRQRMIYKNGISILTENIYLPNIEIYAQNISNKLNLVGAWFFQCKYNKDNILTLLEVAPRIAGAMALSRYKGINLPYLHLMVFINENIIINPLNINLKVYKIYQNYIKSNIKYNDIYCDLDDTIIINDTVNGKLIGKLYDLKMNHNIILITRHKFNVYNTLKKYNISKKLFNNIIHIKDKLISKSSYMKINDILIDDSFNERKDCLDNNILAIDINMIDLL